MRQYLDNVNILTTTRKDFIPFLITYIKNHSFYSPNNRLLNCLTLEQL